MSDEAPILSLSVPGFRLAAVKAGIKASGALDVGVIVAEEPVAAAGVFTRNRFPAAPVLLSRAHLARSGGLARCVLVNAGCANACTGASGQRDAAESAQHVAGALGCAPEEVLVCSTGVIGKPLPMARLRDGATQALAGCDVAGGERDFARAILTTDLVPKTAAVQIDGPGTGSVWGVAKGSGMIAPDMATMLAFLLTDVPVRPEVLGVALREVTGRTFNAVTVDGDTSTNDTVLLLASGAAGGEPLVEPHGARYERFLQALETVADSLARQIAADGEGATKLVRVEVGGAVSERDAERAARAVAQSPLVKTALFGNDPNWGRIVAALGRSGAAVRPESTTVRLAGTLIFERGMGVPFDAEALSRAMQAKEITLAVDLGVGEAGAVVFTCDLSYDYVRINAEYHT